MQRPLRLWPGVAAAALLVAGWTASFVLPPGTPGIGGMLATEIGQIAGLVAVPIIVVWWLFFSRAPWAERIGALVAMAVAVVVVRPLLDPSIIGGAMGALGFILALAPIGLGLVLWAAATRKLSVTARRAALPFALVIAAGATALVRTDGVGGGTMFQLRWRWTPTAEERLLAEVRDDPAPVAPAAAPPATVPSAPAADESAAAVATAPPAAAPAPDAATPVPLRAAEWPGFRGRDRNGVVRGLRINSDWAASPPMELWRRRIGPGWSSFSVAGDLVYTQEQRGDDEIIACYRLSTGEPVWRHRDAVRFYESNGGPGPRGTPTLSNGRVYAFGATGVLNALDAHSGAVVWSRDAAADTGIAVPTWGFASSPVIVGDVVVIAVAGTLAGYDIATGKPRWVGPKHEFSYSSPHLVTIDGVTQVLMLSAPGVVSVAPADGTLLWEHAWEGGAIVQPAMTPDGDLLISGMSTTGGLGMRRLRVSRGSDTWTVQERWTSTGLKPYFNDYVIHNGHAYGFDGNILASIDLADGQRKWKGGRYGAGQMVLLADQDLLLVVTEEGGLALVNATPDKFTEVARAPAIEGKTWNHPAIVGDVLLVRNGEEMAAFRLARAR